MAGCHYMCYNSSPVLLTEGKIMIDENYTAYIRKSGNVILVNKSNIELLLHCVYEKKKELCTEKCDLFIGYKKIDNHVCICTCKSSYRHIPKNDKRIYKK
jgi:hypothetical protein